MNLQVRILATVVVAISPLSTVSLHAQRMAKPVRHCDGWHCSVFRIKPPSPVRA